MKPNADARNPLADNGSLGNGSDACPPACPQPPSDGAPSDPATLARALLAAAATATDPRPLLEAATALLATARAAESLASPPRLVGGA